MKIGVSSYSFTKYISQTKADIFAVIDKAKEMGFEGIEFIGLEAYAKEGEDLILLAEKIKEHCKKAEIEIINYAIGANFLAEDIDAEMEKIKKSVDIAEALGSPCMRHDVCYSLPKEHLYTWHTALEVMAPRIREITEYAKSKGIKTCTENHGYIFQAPERVEALIRAVGNENYGWLCDMGNFLCADVDIVQSVAIAAPYTFHVHVKDFLLKEGNVPCPKGFFTTLGGNHIRGTAIGHGVVPVRNCITALKRVGYDGYVSIEFEGMEDNIPALEAGLDFLKKII